MRYAEMDRQGVVFNAHYLLWCDEAMSAFCRERGLRELAELVRLVSCTLHWKSSATWGDTVDVDVTCARTGRTSFVLDFVIRVGARVCCEVTTTYVNTDESGRPEPLTDAARGALQPDER